jgi:uncharacterized protein (TIGR00106 family)
MSTLLELSIFPMDQGESVSAFVAPVVARLRDSGFPCRLTAMGSIIETDTLAEALALVEDAHQILQDAGCRRVYATLKLDIRDGKAGRLETKVESVNQRIAQSGEI